MSRVNHNAQYIYDVDGETVWEKLRVIRNQLEDRKIALALVNLNSEENRKKITDKDSYEYKKYLIYKDQSEKLIQDCVNEVEFLTQFEAVLAAEAEKTRIPEKTDDEMYEINFFEELALRLVGSAQAQMLASGRMQEETIRRVLKNKQALQMCVDRGFLSPNAIQIAGPNLSIPYNYDTLYLENLKKED